MSRKTMIVLATAAALAGGLTADAFALGGGAYMGGGLGGGAHLGGLGGGTHLGGLGGAAHIGGGFGIKPRPWFTVPRYVPPLPQPEYVRRRPWLQPPGR